MKAKKKRTGKRVASNDGLGGPRYRKLDNGKWCYEWPGAMFCPGVGRTKAEAKADADADNADFCSHLVRTLNRGFP